MTTPISPERNAELSEHYAYCERLLYEQDRDAWLACLFAPRETRGQLHALYAFALEIGSVRDRTTQPLLGEMRLRWWADSLEASTQLDAAGGARAHPVADALVDTIERHALPHAELLDFIDAHIFDLYDDAMETLEDLEAYCDRGAARLMRLSAQVLAGAGNVVAEPFNEAGAALGLTKILRDLPKQAAAGQLFAPRALLARCGAAESDMRSGAATPAVRSALSELRECAHAHYIAAQATAKEAGAARAALLPAALVPIYLDAMARPDYEPFGPAVAPAQWRKQWRLWRASRHNGL
jgi:phytoene synthase